MLNVLEGFALREWGFHSARSIHYMVEAMRQAFRDRNYLLGDPAFVNNPLDRLVSKTYARRIGNQINPGRAGESAKMQPANPRESNQTTPYSIVDPSGNAVSVTYTINAVFGDKIIAGNTGFFLHDEMDDFSVSSGTPNLFGLVQGSANAIAPLKQPLSSMRPTIVLEGEEPLLVFDSPGGPRITITLQTLINVIDYGMDVQAAVDAPRIHHQWLPDTVFIEPFALSADTQAALAAMGYAFEPDKPWGRRK
jgi:gamma-glutamyltranspeptidase/glutathione hydrolase